MDATIELADGRSVGFATCGQPEGTPVLWCHGGPGSRMEPAHLRAEAAEARLWLVGIDRPGYGNVTVLHGKMDKMCDAVNAHHTAEIAPKARLVLYDDLGHFSIMTTLIPTITQLLSRR
jgi:pimeloyl-ACP methyl ester carboxylesterase